MECITLCTKSQCSGVVVEKCIQNNGDCHPLKFICRNMVENEAMEVTVRPGQEVWVESHERVLFWPEVFALGPVYLPRTRDIPPAPGNIPDTSADIPPTTSRDLPQDETVQIPPLPEAYIAPIPGDISLNGTVQLPHVSLDETGNGTFQIEPIELVGPENGTSQIELIELVGPGNGTSQIELIELVGPGNGTSQIEPIELVGPGYIQNTTCPTDHENWWTNKCYRYDECL